MLQLSSEQLLEVTLAIGSAAFAIVAGVFLFVLVAVRRPRGYGWFWAWALVSAGMASQSLGLLYPAYVMLFAYLATACAIAAGFFSVRAAFDFVRVSRLPSWALTVLGAAAATALMLTWLHDRTGVLYANEIALAAATGLMAISLFPAARETRMSGLQTAWAASALLTVMMLRTLISGAFLASHDQRLNELYWIFEVIGGGILAFILAMGELVAMLDEVRVELEDTNNALSGAMQGLEVAAKTDPLTGLHNRYAFHTAIVELRRNRSLEGSIAALDLNGLKRINDAFGHDAGDRALRSLAHRLQQVVRASDCVFRWGGDEFVVLLFDTTPEVARERLGHMEPPEPLQMPGHGPVPLSVSWGVAALTSDVEGALKQADAQLYHQRRLLRTASEKVGPL